MAKPINVDSGIRRHDADMLARGARLGFRVKEPDWAECYFCDGRDVQDSREHIVPRWLHAALDMAGQELRPEYYSGADRSGGRDLPKPTHGRGEIPAASLVTKGICTDCNNGWMSALESGFQPFVAAKDDVAPGVVAQWFIKTAFVLNVSQNTRLLVPREVRLDLAAGRISERVSVYFHDLNEPVTEDVSFNWAQGAQVPVMTIFDAGDTGVKAAIEDGLRRLWACSIRIGTLVGTVVVSPPGEAWASSWEAVGAVAVRSGQIRGAIDWLQLPRLTSFTHGMCLIPVSTPWFNSFTNAVEMLPWPEGVRGVLELRRVIFALRERLAEDRGAEARGGAEGAALDLKKQRYW